MKFLFYPILFFTGWLSSLDTFAQANESRPIIIGESVSFYSRILGEKRLLNIYLPEGYQQNDSMKFPVVYLLDGGIDEDFIHITGLFQFAAFSWIHWFPPAIIVGIVNTDRMRDMTGPTSDTAMKRLYPSSGGSENFIRFIAGELKPYIQSHYKVSDKTSLIGESLGGLVATEILLKNPLLFKNYFIVSPSLWWNNRSLLRISSPVEKSSWQSDIHIYIAVGKEGLTPGIHPRLMKDDVKALAEKIGKGKSSRVHVFYNYLPGENHATIMHQAILDGLKAQKNTSLRQQE